MIKLVRVLDLLFTKVEYIPSIVGITKNIGFQIFTYVWTLLSKALNRPSCAF